MIAEMKLRLEAVRALALQVAAMKAQFETAGARYSAEVSMAKLYASEMVAYVTDTALQLRGGYGFTQNLPL
jgi:alkylation response protein AidB-like acyl-CoA dehydrogenase